MKNYYDKKMEITFKTNFIYKLYLVHVPVSFHLRTIELEYVKYLVRVT